MVGDTTPATDAYFNNALGIPKAVTHGGAALAARARIQVSEDGYFEPRDDGLPAVVVPCGVQAFKCVGWEDINDLVAFSPKAPGRWYRRSGVARFCGEDRIAHAVHRGMILAVYETPLSWLQHGVDGVCIVDWDGGLALDFPEELRAVACETISLGRRLEAALRPPKRGPEVRVIQAEARHAA